MLRTPFTKILRDRWMGMAIAAVSIGAMVWLAGLVYRDLDDQIESFFSQMPETFTRMLGLVGGSGAVALVLSEMIGFIGPLTLGGLAISIGTGTIAREEKEGTFELLLAHPLSRTRVALEAAAATALLIVAGGALLHATIVGAIAVLGVDVVGLHLAGAIIHLTALALLFGMLATAMGAWTGNAGVSSGSAAGLLVMSWLVATLLPLVDSIAGFAKVSPWHYLSAASPLLNGADWGHVAVLLGASVVLVGLAVVGLNRRDLRSGWTGGTMRERLASNERLAFVVARLSGNGQAVGSVTTKTLGDSRLMASVTGIILLGMALVMGILYNAIDDVLVQLGGALPEAMLQVLGIEDFSTVYGFLNAEIFSITGPIAVVYVATVMAGRGIGGEQDSGSMDLLLANPVSRRHVLLAKAAATTIIVVGLAFLLGLATWAGTAMVGIDLPVAGVLGVSAHLAALGLLFGAFAFLVAAWTGRGRTAIAATAGVAVATYVVSGFLAVNERFSGAARATPWYYYIEANPLQHGLEPTHVGILLGVTAVFMALAVAVFERVDIRL